MGNMLQMPSSNLFMYFFFFFVQYISYAIMQQEGSSIFICHTLYNILSHRKLPMNPQCDLYQSFHQTAAFPELKHWYLYYKAIMLSRSTCNKGEGQDKSSGEIWRRFHGWILNKWYFYVHTGSPCYSYFYTSSVAPLTWNQQLLQEEFNWEKNKFFMNFYFC